MLNNIFFKPFAIASIFCISVSAVQAGSLKGKSFETRGTVKFSLCYPNSKLCFPVSFPLNYSIYVGKRGTIYSYTGKDKGKILSPNKVYKKGKVRSRFRVTGSNLNMSSQDENGSLRFVIAVRNGKCGVKMNASSKKFSTKKVSSNLRCKIVNGNGFSGS